MIGLAKKIDEGGYYEMRANTCIMRSRFMNPMEFLDYKDPLYQELWQNQSSGRKPIGRGEGAVW